MKHHQALAVIKNNLFSVDGGVTLPVAEAGGRVVSEDIIAGLNLPGCDNAAVDGYAFCHDDYLMRGGALTVSGRSLAGNAKIAGIMPGQAIRIFTGAPMPEGADTVAMQEDVAVQGDQITISAKLKPGANRRLVAEDIKSGEVLVVRGTKLAPQDLAHCAAVGLSELPVFRKVKIAIASTGNELRTPGDRKGEFLPGQVYDANRAMLIDLVKKLGCEVCDLRVIADKRQCLSEVLMEAGADNDILITTGGASVGDEDHVSTLLREIGHCLVTHVDIKPGRPFKFGDIGATAFFGLPGNPVAVMVCFLLYVFPFIVGVQGGEWFEAIRYNIPINQDITAKKPGRREFVRVRLRNNPKSGQLVLDKFPTDGSGIIRSLRASDGLIELDEQSNAIFAGDLVKFIPFSEFGIFPGKIINAA